ncbi:type II toxin-antitoxin system PemK/MazF family toxin [Carnobacterium maltaromaticum]|uniref:type II toxin-antitoxin system PemK/MazF family toxin n=1 Tax=Carnobacterium maltaromaticum TaxID=2751 RepID=UPI0039AF71DE
MNNNDRKLEKSRKISNWFISKEVIAHDWIESDEKQKNRHLKQGQVYNCELGENIGYEISKNRPVLVVSDTCYSQQGQVVIIPLTKNVRPMRTHYVLKSHKYSFLTFDSTVKSEQIRSVSSGRLNSLLGTITDEDMSLVKLRIKTIFNI